MKTAQWPTTSRFEESDWLKVQCVTGLVFKGGRGTRARGLTCWCLVIAMQLTSVSSSRADDWDDMYNSASVTYEDISMGAFAGTKKQTFEGTYNEFNIPSDATWTAWYKINNGEYTEVS